MRKMRNKIRKHNVSPDGMLRLTPKEYSELFLEGAVTLFAVFIIYIGILGILDQTLDYPLQIEDDQLLFREYWNLRTDNILFYYKIYNTVSVIFAFGFTSWRLIRRYRQMQLAHVLDELHRIATNDQYARIPFQLNGDMGKVVESINHLVDSTNRAMEEERKIEKSKDELITNVSHDLRTPLTSIIGYLGLITNGPHELEEEPKHYATVAYNKAQQMKVLVDELFEYTTMRPGGVPLRLSDVSINNFLEQVAADFELDVQKKDMSIEMIPSTKPIVLEIDAEKMVRVISNLLSNAVKYGEEGTAITIETKEENGIVSIAIKNSGPTIPTEVLNKLFYRFYRAEGSRSKETGGTGLGLAIAENIIHMHGGVIRAESVEHETSFYIFLPSENHSALKETTDYFIK
ncbi:His Kinase A (phospho-acceptor) domain-containing protein [Granulicatella balaenopterae]|uniref:histidine kinase n=1 Tax=Granulicatella balaenopterae TaxID=137733 RepID=A0A1H9MAL8_9LACT|nr:ATP-binding protein [Granulicatella balaenopterae]SER20495.1 His Kinase A (phospho-acceptor) domain-containing protein [Granulicatella balaenopterae]